MATIPTDTNFSQQWHLRNTASGEYDLNVVDVWDDYTGKGVMVFVLDSGVDYNNADIAANYNATLSYDFGNSDADPAPATSGDNHGTAVSGIIGAAANNDGVVGIAYESTLVSCRLGSSSIPWVASTAALNHGTDNGAEVINMSWGSAYNFDDRSDDGETMMAAFDRAAVEGRGGLGIILVKSAGNARDDGMRTDINAQITGNNTHMILTAAVDRDGTVTSYSTPGATLLISAFGSPIPGEVVTTDRVGAAGYSSDDVCTNFNGTSAAAPMISGVAALMLDANPNLGWRDVQTILAYSARHVGSDIGSTVLSGYEQAFWAFNGADDWNGGGLHFSTDYGYGLVDAKAAVRLAETWNRTSTSANEVSASSTFFDTATPKVINDGDPDGSTFKGKIAKDMEVERIAVTLEFTAQNMEDVEIYVTGPDGKRHRLISDVPQGDYNYVEGYGERGYTFTSQEFRGEIGKGTWKIQVDDDSVSWVTTVSRVKLEVFGAAASDNDTYVYTNEFSDFLDSHSRNLSDGNGGVDILNASAVTSAMVVDLAKGKGQIDGVSMKINGIEHVYGGDGDDTLTGNSGNNDIAGGRGMDQLAGGKGKDDFVFWVARDSRGITADTIADFGDGDDIDLKHIDAIAGTDANEKFTFVGKGDLGGTAGLLRYESYKAFKTTYVEGDVDGDGVADFLVALKGLHSLKAADFIL